MFHFGDAPDAGYTDQGRGRGATVWVNNEYDRAHACTLFYALTGERRALESGIVAARHWLDVDLCHRSDDPLRHGGLVAHSAHHVTEVVTPSHECRFTADRRYLKAAARQFAVLLDRGLGGMRSFKKFIEGDAVIRGVGSGRGFASSYTSLIIFASAAGKAGLLERFEYPI